MTTKEFNEIKKNLVKYVLKEVTFKFTDYNGKEAIHTGCILEPIDECLMLIDGDLDCKAIVHHTDVYLK